MLNEASKPHEHVISEVQVHSHRHRHHHNRHSRYAEMEAQNVAMTDADAAKANDKVMKCYKTMPRNIPTIYQKYTKHIHTKGPARGAGAGPGGVAPPPLGILYILLYLG